MQLQFRHRRTKLLHAGIGQLAYFRVFQRYRIAIVYLVANAIHAHQFARHKKTGNLIAPVVAGDNRFQETGAHHKQRIKPVAVAKQEIALFQAAAAFDNRINTLYRHRNRGIGLA